VSQRVPVIVWLALIRNCKDISHTYARLYACTCKLYLGVRTCVHKALCIWRHL